VKSAWYLLTCKVLALVRAVLFNLTLESSDLAHRFYLCVSDDPYNKQLPSS
jgi:hypothetical protein